LAIINKLLPLVIRIFYYVSRLPELL